MLSSILLVAAQSQSAIRPPQPPYLREATQTVFKSSYNPEYLVAGSTFYVANGDQCLAYSLPSMKKLWAASMPKEERAETMALAGNALLVGTAVFSASKSSSLLALNIKNGKTLWKLARSGDESPIAVSSNTIYTSLKPKTLSAIDLKTRRTLWTTPPWKTKDREFGTGVDAVTASPTVVLFNSGDTTYAVSAKTGKPLWNQTQSYMFQGTLFIQSGVAWVEVNEGSVGRDALTGKLLWSHPSNGLGEYGEIVNGKFVGSNRGTAQAIEPKTGKILWSHEVGPSDTSGGYQYGSLMGDLLFVLGINEGFISDLNGKKLWSGKPDEMPPHPIWHNSEFLICFDGERLLRYKHGQEAPLPTDSVARQELARKWVSEYDKLDGAGKKKLTLLGDDAFSALLDEFIKTCNKHDAMGEKGDSYPLYSRYHDLAQLLEPTVSPKRAPDLIKAYEALSPKSSAKPFILGLLAKHGDPKDVTPYFLKELEQEKTPDFEMYESATYVARSYILTSKDPRAVAYMLKTLLDPKGDEVVKLNAYWHLAGSGGAKEVETVKGLQTKRALLPSLGDRVLADLAERDSRENRRKPDPIPEKKSADGRIWALITSSVLGSRGDLYLVEKANGKWTNPIFLGVSTEGVSRWSKPAPPEPTVAGKTAKQIIASDWVELLVGNAAISLDSDKDGLTDIAEKRLGTDPKKADTDGDADLDGVDPFPNAPSRQLTDDEQVLSAVFEARYHGNVYDEAALFFAPKDMKPFEMAGRFGPTIWTTDSGTRWTHPLEHCYEQGVAFIRMSKIQWSSDKSTAIVEISTYYGGLNGTGYQASVKKFGDQWVVTSMRMSYIS